MGNESSKGSNSPKYQQQVPTRSRIDPSAEAINYARERANEIIRQQRNDFRPSPQPAQTQPPSTARSHHFNFTQQQVSAPTCSGYSRPAHAPTPAPAPKQTTSTDNFRTSIQTTTEHPLQAMPRTNTPTNLNATSSRSSPLRTTTSNVLQAAPRANTPTNLNAASSRSSPLRTTSSNVSQVPPRANTSTNLNTASSSSNMERERNPYSFTRQQLSNASDKKTNLYPDLGQCSPSSQNSDITNGYVVVNSSLKEVQSSGREIPSAPSESILNERQGRGAIPKQRPRSSQFNSDIYKCRTCKRIFGTEIYQCDNGHSSCGHCKQTGRQCGDCRSPISETRNYALQDLLTDMGMKPQTPIFETCPNSKAGCTLRFKPSEVQDHLKECPFQDMNCPVNIILKRCDWVGKQKDINIHFEKFHPEHLQGDVNKELFLTNIVNDDRLLYLIHIGPFNFLVHFKVCSREKNIYMAAQFLGTKFSAQKWSFELHIYNKREPRRKYTYNDICRVINEPVEDLFRVNDCAILPLSYAMSFVNEGCIAFKFFIKKKNDDDDESGRRDRSRARPNNRTHNWRNKQ